MKNLTTTAASLAVFMAALGFALPANATIVGAVSGTVDFGGSNPDPGISLTNTYNQAGLSQFYIPETTDFDEFVATTTHTFAFSGFEWFSEGLTSSSIVTYDLGSERRIDRMALWNDDGAGIGTLDLLFSTDGTSFTSLVSGLKPTDNPLRLDYRADVFSFAATNMRFMLLLMSDCPQPIGDGYPGCSIGEVAFGLAPAPEPAPVPVPAAGLLLLSAMGGLGLMRRRKRG